MGEQVAASTKKRRADAEPPRMFGFSIDTGTDEQQLIAADPASRALLFR
ncbi:hypothetical protein HJV72_19065 [Extibacter sp. GGCC_0201]|nr:hypothetical protein [Extibacter sp. GGCC_0201]